MSVTLPDRQITASRRKGRRKPPPLAKPQGPIIPLDWCYETFDAPENSIWRIELRHALSVLHPGVVVSMVDDMGLHISVGFSISPTSASGLVISPECGLPASGTIGVAYSPLRTREMVDDHA